MPDRRLELILGPEALSICRLPPGVAIPEWAQTGIFVAITRTSEELSIICPSPSVPAGVPSNGGWRAVKVQGPWTFSEVGVLRAVVDPLTDAGISLLAVCTFDTDYVLVRQAELTAALQALKGAGHHVADQISIRKQND